MHRGESTVGQQAKSPHPREQGRRHAESDHVRQRIEFAAKVAGGIGHASYATVKPVCYHRHANRQGSVIKMPELLARAQHRLAQRVIASADIRRSKQRRQNVHAFAHAVFSHRRKLVFPSPHWRRHFHRKAPVFSRFGEEGDLREGITLARMLDPPLTRSPSFTLISAGCGKMTSVREPNLIMPTRCPRASFAPGLGLNTIRRASSPAICLKTTVIPSPSRVTIFCSLSLAEDGAMALPNWPFL